MTDPTPNPPDPKDSSGGDAPLEGGIDRALSEATSLLEQLEEQLGSCDGSPAALTSLYVEDPAPSEEDFQDEADEIEAILDDVAPSDRSAAEHTPTAEVGEVEAPANPSGAPARSPAEPVIEVANPRARRVATKQKLRELAAKLGRIKAPARAAARRVGDALLKTCDFLDAVFAFVNYDVRRILGWLAVVLLVAACAVTASSWSS